MLGRLQSGTEPVVVQEQSAASGEAVEKTPLQIAFQGGTWCPAYLHLLSEEKTGGFLGMWKHSMDPVAKKIYALTFVHGNEETRSSIPIEGQYKLLCTPGVTVLDVQDLLQKCFHFRSVENAKLKESQSSLSDNLSDLIFIEKKRYPLEHVSSSQKEIVALIALFNKFTTAKVFQNTLISNFLLDFLTNPKMEKENESAIRSIPIETIHVMQCKGLNWGWLMKIMEHGTVEQFNQIPVELVLGMQDGGCSEKLEKITEWMVRSGRNRFRSGEDKITSPFAFLPLMNMAADLKAGNGGKPEKDVVENTR
jgi:hypothetical protein